MSLEEEKKLNQNEGVRGLLKEDHKAELGKILAFGEKYKKEGKMLEQKFWIHGKRRDYKDLLRYYEKNKENFEGLLPEEKDMLDSLDGVARDKFYKEYLFDRIVYSGGSVKHERVEDEFYRGKGEDLENFRNRVHNVKNRIKPGVTINLFHNNLGSEGAKILAEEWKDCLQPGMSVHLGNNKIGKEGLEVIVKAWKGKLYPGMEITLEDNEIGDEGVKLLAEGWKDSLKPGMNITLDKNEITNEGLRAITQAWKDKLQTGMIVNLGYNKMGDEGVKILVENRKDSLQPGMILGLRVSHISEKGVDMLINNLELKEGVKIDLSHNFKIGPNEKEKLREWVQKYKNRGINCEVLFD